MRRRFSIFLVLALTLAMSITGVALAFDSGGNPAEHPGDNTVQWTGQGADGGKLNTSECDANNTPYLLWVFTTDHGSAENVTLHLSGSGFGDYNADTTQGSNFHFVTPYFTPDNNLAAYVDFTVVDTGNGNWNLLISHGCAGPEFKPLTASKTAKGSYDRTVTWELAKSADPTSFSGEAGDTINQSELWTVDATKHESLGSYKVTGEITVNNPNSVPVDFSISDKLSDGTVADVSCPAFTVPAASGGVDGSMVCTYTALPGDANATKNTATVTSKTTGVDGATAEALVSFDENLIGDDSVKLADERFNYEETVSAGTTKKFDDSFECPSDASLYNDGKYSFEVKNTATLKGDNTNLSKDATVDVNCTLPKLTAEKTAAGSYDHTITWTLEKSVAPSSFTGSFGQTNIGPATWTVKATKTEVDDNYQVTGEIKVTNPAKIAQTFNVKDMLDTGNEATVSCPNYTIPANDSVTCTYTVDAKDATLNTATVSAAGNADVVATAAVEYKANVIGDESVTLADPRFSYSETINTNTIKTFPETFACSNNVADYGTNDSISTDYKNTATLTGDSTGTLTANAKVTVTCKVTWKSETATGYGLPWSQIKGAPSTWFWYTPWTALQSNQTVNLIAGQYYVAGKITATRDSTNTYITITLNPGYRFANVLSNLKIQDFASKPTSYVQPGSFKYKFNVPSNQTSITVTIPGATAQYYGIAADVQRIVP